MKFYFLLQLFFFTSDLILTFGVRILGIFPFPAKSHFNFNNAVMRSLAKAGHDVVVITSFPKQASAENFTVIDISDGTFIYVGQSSINDFAKLSAYTMLNIASGLEKSYCEKVLQHERVLEILNSNEKQFDVVFVEILLLYKCFLPVAQKLGVPIIGTVTFKSWTYADNAINNPNNPAYIPFEMGVSWKYDNFFERMKNTWNSLLSSYFWYFGINPILNEFYENNAKLLSPYKKFLVLEPDLIFYNNHPSFMPRPMNPNAIEVGGLHIESRKALPQDIKKFIDEAEHGVILFSFGSLVKTASMNRKIQSVFKEVFAEIPQKVIWKFEDPMDDVSSNVMLSKWLPQRDILEHENVKAFISHCGQAGTYEAIYGGTPIIAFPLFGDQPSNAAILEHLGVAVHLDIDQVTKEIVLNALNSVINETKYYDNMQKLSKLFKSRPMTPQDTVVYWTEYVITNKGAPHMKLTSSQLNWFQYSLLDVIGFVIVMILTCLFVLVRTLKVLFLFIKSRKKNYRICKNKYS